MFDKERLASVSMDQRCAELKSSNNYINLGLIYLWFIVVLTLGFVANHYFWV